MGNRHSSSASRLRKSSRDSANTDKSPPSYSSAPTSHFQAVPQTQPNPPASVDYHHPPDMAQRAQVSSLDHRSQIYNGSVAGDASFPQADTFARDFHGTSQRGKNEDEFKILDSYNTVFIVDDSCSMAGEPWQQTRSALCELVSIAAQHDKDGIDIHFLNSPLTGTNLQARQIEGLFDSIQPTGEVTLIGSKLEDLLLPYLSQIESAQRESIEKLKKIKRVNYIIITDGAPMDSPEEVIVTAARRLDRGNFPLSQMGIQFLQVGDSREATDYLKELDDVVSKEHQIRDMVDTTPYAADFSGHFLMKCLLGGINRRVDRRRE